MSIKIPVTPSEIEPAIFRLVAQYLTYVLYRNKTTFKRYCHFDWKKKSADGCRPKQSLRDRASAAGSLIQSSLLW